MSTESNLQIKSVNLNKTLEIARCLGQALTGGEVIEFISDVGGGKTTFVRGLVAGAGSDDQVSSPTFTISKLYQTDKFDIHHYDFYRLDDAGLMRAEIQESLSDDSVVLIEWSDIVKSVLPKERLQIKIKISGESERNFEFINTGGHAHLIEAINDFSN